MKKRNWKRSAAVLAAVHLALASPVTALAEIGGTARQGETEVQEMTAQETAVLETAADEAAVNAYYNGAVLVGDSVMKDFRNYAMRRSSDPLLGGIRFLAAGCFSIHNSLWPVSEESVHPIYQGQQRPVWESLGMMEAKRIFLFFGLNDMNMGPLDETCAMYLELIGNIKSTCPEAEIHLISMTYALKGTGKGNMNNDTVREFNSRLRQMAAENGWGYMNLVDALSDGEGNLRAEYCSDGFVHQTAAAYDVWVSVLREYGKSQLNGTAEFPIGGRPEYQAGSTVGNGENQASENGQTESAELTGATGPAGDLSAGAGRKAVGPAAQ